DRYLGSSEPRKKRKLRDRKFEFDWNEADDTSTDYNDLYTNRHTIQFFGRGNIAGIDTDVQKKNLDQVYKNLKHG
ncbi:MAG: DEAD (Asp-Glu-Ala-Asp) box polypeptide 23, partial [Paramarteilia canceri]